MEHSDNDTTSLLHGCVAQITSFSWLQLLLGGEVCCNSRLNAFSLRFGTILYLRIIICREVIHLIFLQQTKSTNGCFLKSSLNITKSLSLSLLFFFPVSSGPPCTSLVHFLILFLTWVVFLSCSNGCLPFVVFSSGRTLFSNIYIRSPKQNKIVGPRFLVVTLSGGYSISDIFNPAQCATLWRFFPAVHYLYHHALVAPCERLSAHTNYSGTFSS